MFENIENNKVGDVSRVNNVGTPAYTMVGMFVGAAVSAISAVKDKDFKLTGY